MPGIQHKQHQHKQRAAHEQAHPGAGGDEAGHEVAHGAAPCRKQGIGQLRGYVVDVITAGTATRESVGIIEKEGGKVVGLVIALNRQEKGNDSDLSAVQQIEKDYNFPVVSIVDLNSLINYLNQSGELSSYLEAITKYREMYGA